MNTMKKIQADKNGCKYILFRIDIYLSECFLALEIDEKGHTVEKLFLKKKDKKHQKKNLVVNLLELIKVMQKMVMIQIIRLVMYNHLSMSSKIKYKKIRKTISKRKRNEREIRKRNESRKQKVKIKDKNRKLKNLTNNC